MSRDDAYDPHDPHDHDDLIASAHPGALVYTLLNVGQTDRARSLVVGWLSGAPEDPDLLTLLARVELAADAPEAALRAAEQAVAHGPADPDAHLMRALAHVHLGHFARAEEAFLESIALEPGDPSAHLGYARLLATCGKPRLALEPTRTALGLDPDDAEAQALYATLLVHARPGDPVADQAAKRAVALDPEDPIAHAALGHVHLLGGRVALAEASFRESLRLDPNGSGAMHGLAQALMARKPLYRPLLSWSVWVSRRGEAVGLTVIFGLWFLVSAARAALKGEPGAEGVREAIFWVYLGLCAYTWFAEPITRYLLSRAYPWMRDLR